MYSQDDEEKTCHDKLKNLKIQKIPAIDIRPGLVVRKLANVRIQPGNKKVVRNSVYREFTFAPETTSASQGPSSVRPEIAEKNKSEARDDVRKVLCDMLDEVPWSIVLKDDFIDRLRDILTNLEHPSANDADSSRLENLVAQHSAISFNETTLRKKLLEIVEKSSGNVDHYERDRDVVEDADENDFSPVW